MLLHGSAKALEERLRKVEYLDTYRDIPLKGLTTLKIGGNARIFLVPKTPEALAQVIHHLTVHGAEFHIIGAGSNVIIADEGLECVVDMRGLTWFRELDGNTVEVGAGMRLKRLLPILFKRGLSGIELLSGIPGTLGGVVAMNAGAHGQTIKDVVKEVLIVDPQGVRWVSKEEMGFKYRGTQLLEAAHTVVAGVRLVLETHFKDRMRQRVKAVMCKRRRSQPIGAKSAGCVFKNPAQSPAGALIDASGLKGFHVGDAYISRRHANFILNRKNAKAKDVVELIKRVREKVLKDHGILLEPEVKGLGVRF